MPWVEISQAAFTLGISERTLRNWIKSGKINAKTEQGQRMVEIPEEEFSTSDNGSGPADNGERFDEAYSESETGTSLDTQKRLEVALLECGRVKGTLASQERIMETLSANIAELTAKLQKSQNWSWKLVVACVVVAFLGTAAVLMRGSYHQAELLKKTETFAEELQAKESLIREAENNANAKERELLSVKLQQREEFDKRLKKELIELEERKARTHKEAISELKKEFRELLDKSEAALKEQRVELQKKNAELLKLTQTFQKITEERDRLQLKLEEQARLLEDFDRLKKQYRELESELIESRRKQLRR
ncbi:MAG: hypothetical protein ACYTFY_14005 [Planctomycetota bacterium]|jgi:DNA repair exonuclease SbcCD ATPase subunit